MPKYIELLGDAIRIGIQALGTLTRYVGLTSDGPVLEVRGGVVVQAELAQGKLAGRYSSGAGEIQPITPSGGLAIDGSGNLTYSGGISDHDDLGNLDWDISGHIGDADKIASFNSSSEAAYLTVGPGLTVSGSTLQSASPWKAVARLATTAAGTLATSFANGQTVDGVTLVTGDRILLKDQSPSDDNGLYTVNASGAPTRATDASTAALSQGLAVWIAEGSVNAHTVWVIDSDPVAAGNYRFKGLVKSGSSDTGFLAKNGATSAQGRTLTAGPNIYIENGTGVSGDPTISVKGSVGVGGRLTLESGVPWSTTDQMAKTTVYWVPYNGPYIPIYDSTVGDYVNRESTGCDVAVPPTKFCLYDIFAYWTGSAVDLETVDWFQVSTSINAFNAGTQTFTTSSAHGLTAGADIVGIDGITGTVGSDSTYGVNGRMWAVATTPSSTTFTLAGSNLGSLAYTSGGTVRRIVPIRATGITLTNGIYTKSGDATRTYLGTGMTTGVSGQTEMSFGTVEPKLLLWNNYNRELTCARALDQTSHTYATNAWRYWNNSPANRVIFVNGRALNIEPIMASSLEDNTGYVAYGIDGTSGVAPTLRNGNTALVAMSTTRKILSAAGCHILGAVEYGESGFTTHYSDLYCSLMM